MGELVERPVCRRCHHPIPLEVARVSDAQGVTCIDCLTFDNRLTDTDRRFLRAVRIEATK